MRMREYQPASSFRLGGLLFFRSGPVNQPRNRVCLRRESSQLPHGSDMMFRPPPHDLYGGREAPLSRNTDRHRANGRRRRAVLHHRIRLVAMPSKALWAVSQARDAQALRCLCAITPPLRGRAPPSRSSRRSEVPVSAVNADLIDHRDRVHHRPSSRTTATTSMPPTPEHRRRSP